MTRFAGTSILSAHPIRKSGSPLFDRFASRLRRPREFTTIDRNAPISIHRLEIMENPLTTERFAGFYSAGLARLSFRWKNLRMAPGKSDEVSGTAAKPASTLQGAISTM